MTDHTLQKLKKDLETAAYKGDFQVVQEIEDEMRINRIRAVIETSQPLSDRQARRLAELLTAPAPIRPFRSVHNARNGDFTRARARYRSGGDMEDLHYANSEPIEKAIRAECSDYSRWALSRAGRERLAAELTIL